MDQKTWLWRKRSGQKSLDSNNESENEAERLQYDKEAALERTVKNLHEKIASLLCECNAKDIIIVQHSKTAQEAIAGQEKTVAEMALQNKELEAAMQQKLEANERLSHLNSALKDYRHQLSVLKEEQDERVSEAVDEIKRAHKKLDEKFTETSKKLANLTVENAQLTKALMIKEELIEDVSHQMSQATMEFNELISKLDYAEKENDILKYEYRVLEREFEIQNRCADMANRQHQESVKRAAKLEAECQKLRSVVKKQITWSNDKRMVFMVNRLCEVEEENKILKENMRKKDDEIRLLQAEFVQTRCEDRHTIIKDSDMSLMDDFVEMEKLAIVSSDASNLDSVGKELVPVSQGEDSDWLQSVLKAILEQNCVSKRGFVEILEEIKVNLQKSQHDLDPVSGYIMWKYPDSEKSIVSIKPGLENTKDLKTIEDQLENQKLINEELDHKLSVAKVQINEANQKVSALKVELEDRSHCCEELEATCLDLQLQLASVSQKDVANVDVEQQVKLVQTGWEVTAASAKLAECQETIFSIGRQLQALTPPTETAEFLLTDKQSKSSEHSSLRDRMIADDIDNMDDPLSSPKTKEMITVTETKTAPPAVIRVGSCRSRVGPGSLVIVPSKKRGKGFELLRKLLFRKKRGSNKKVLTIGA